MRMAVESPRWKVPWQNVGRGRGATALREKLQGSLGLMNEELAIHHQNT